MEVINQKKYIYSAFGLIFLSDIEIPTFLQSEGEEDVKILFGNVPGNIDNPIYTTPELKVSTSEFLFLHNEADYYVKDGNTVIVNIHENLEVTVTEGFLTGIVMGALLFQRGLLVIHGSSVEADGKGLIFTGSSGAGKSTICAALRKNGFGFLSDDITVVKAEEDGSFAILPSFPQQRLTSLVARTLGYNLKKLTPSDDKYLIEDKGDFVKEPVPVFSIFTMNPEERRNVELKPVTGTDKVKSLIENLYFSEIFMKAASTEYFMKLSGFAKTISWYSVNKPVRKYSIHKQMKMIMDTVQVS